MIKLIMFDLDDTLIDHHAGAQQAMHTLSKLIVELGYADNMYDFSTFYDAYEKYNLALWPLFEKGQIDIATLLARRFTYIHDWFEINKIHQKQIKDAFWDTYVKNCPLISGWIFILQKLHSKFFLAICSNGMETIQRQKLMHNNLLPLFHRLYFGSSHPNCKPDPAFYLKILSDFHVKPENVLMIGDSIKNDINPCKELGMQTLHYSGTTSFQQIYKSITELINGSDIYS
ncbi:HAD family hydrolase [Xenorhabdus nematophila]|uniref:HAD family hydrolase n=1 Tax=Xenorhabdus nematophila TaxID=628 RepID=UPI0032B849D5